MSATTDPVTYPISPAAARQLERPIFGHVIDGEVVPSLDGATMPVIDPDTGQRIATAVTGSKARDHPALRGARGRHRPRGRRIRGRRRARRPLRPSGLRRRALALPGAAGEGAAPAPPG